MVDYAAIERLTLLVDAASGLVFLALGIWILTLRPRRPVTLVLGVFAAALGVDVVVDNLAQQLGWLPPRWTSLQLVARPLAGAAAALLALIYPRPLALAGRKRVLTVPLAILGLQLFGGVVSAADRSGLLNVVGSLAFAFSLGATWFALAIFAGRFAGTSAPDERRALAVVTVALALENTVRTGIGVAVAGQTGAVSPFAGPSLLAVLVITALWLRNTTRGPEPARRLARNVALIFPAVLFLAAAFAAATVPTLAYNLGPMGLSRIAGVLLLAWAILRGFLPGVDARVRWGISKSTVAAVFVAVFFVASEGAQQFFGETLESTYLGIAAAGALVFAIAPLQRAAERFAARAVPVASHAGIATAATRGSDSFRRAVRLALKDRTLTHDEELDLATVAHDLGLTAPEATRIRLEVEREIRMGGDTGSST